MNFAQKVHLSNMVSTACSMQDIGLLKKLLPSAESLVEYHDMSNGGGFLHTLMRSNGDRSVDFLNQVIKEYGLGNNKELEKQLFLKRNSSGKYAADFTYIYQFLHPKPKKQFEEFRGRDVSQMTDLTDNRSDFEKEKIALYLKIKKHIQSFKTDKAKDVAFGISDRYIDASDNSFDRFSKGTPVSNPLYLPDKDGKPALYVKGSVVEEYPEIRLLNYADKETGTKEDVCVLRGIKVDSKETFLSQAIDKIDFPEDFGIHFQSLKVFEDDYKNLKNNEGTSATYRYFTQGRGAVVFESKQQNIDGNSNSSGYGGYITSEVTKEDGKYVGYPIIVLPSGFTFGVQCKYDKNDKSTFANTERKLYHELFHGIDLNGDTHFSEMPLFKYAMMLEESNPKGKFDYIFNLVNKGYKKDFYNIEMAAYIMGVANKDILADSPLLAKVYELGECFSVAKSEGNEKALSHLMTATDKLPDNLKLRIAHNHFMVNKGQGKQSKLDEDKRRVWENQLIKLMDGTIEKMKNTQKGRTNINRNELDR